ncbi:MAG: pantetheine-phosphate adenylyltransferase [Endomicrobium sp.]|jgi:pantetheine-phosphate adenylyltransferase|nr:pantetheine-phosphate adenylyltransferase [Endomicrobium sp.]
MNNKIAIFPGSFDPPTNGHLNIIIRALNLFPKIMVAVTNNLNKNHWFSLEERINFLEEITKNLKNVQILSFSGLLANYVKEKKIFIIIRGLRIVSDFEYELQMATINKKLNNDIETIFLIPDYSYSFLTSALIRELALLESDISNFIPKCIEKELKERAFLIKKKNLKVCKK